MSAETVGVLASMDHMGPPDGPTGNVGLRVADDDGSGDAGDWQAWEKEFGKPEGSQPPVATAIEGKRGYPFNSGTHWLGRNALSGAFSSDVATDRAAPRFPNVPSMLGHTTLGAHYINRRNSF